MVNHFGASTVELVGGKFGIHVMLKVHVYHHSRNGIRDRIVGQAHGDTLAELLANGQCSEVLLGEIIVGGCGSIG